MSEEVDSVEITQLRAVVSDLTRRIQNSHYIIESEKKIAQNASNQIDVYEKKLFETMHLLRLESSKRTELERDKRKGDLSTNYDALNQKIQKIQMEIKIALVDHSMTKLRKEPEKVVRMRNRLAQLQQEQEDRRVLLQQIIEAEQLEEALRNAVQHNHVNECRQLLSQHQVSVNYRDLAGYLPLHYAVKRNYLEICKLLLEKGSDYSSYISGHSALVIAASEGHLNIIQLLKDDGADLEDKGSGGVPALVMAASRGHVACVELLLSLGADPNSQDLQENTALHSLAESSARDGDGVELETMLAMLLQAGADPKRTNRMGETPLLAALRFGNLKLARALGSIQ